MGSIHGLKNNGWPVVKIRAYKDGAQGLSSYRATLEHHFRLCFMGRSPHLSDEQWINLFSSRMLIWFATERQLLMPGSPTILEYLHSSGLIDLGAELSLDKERSCD